MPPKVSVIIPTYNGGRYLGETLRSVLSQSFLDHEVIVVDDGSDEDIRSVVDAAGSNIRYVRQERRGPAAARNHGVRLSGGKYIAFLDHDDLWEPDNLETLVSVFETHPRAGLVYSYPRLIDAYGAFIPTEQVLQSPSGRVFEDFLLRNRITSFSATMIRRDVFDEVGGLDECPEIATCDDYDLWLKIADCYEVIFAPGNLVRYRVHQHNLVRNYKSNLSAHLHVFSRALRERDAVRCIPKMRLNYIKIAHMKNKYRYMAYKVYYEGGDIRLARRLSLLALCYNPCDCALLRHVARCHLPPKFLDVVRRARNWIKTFQASHGG